MNNKKNGKKIIKILKRLYPNSHCSLHYQNIFQLLVAVQLSAQCTDERVNIVTPNLFKELPAAEDFANVKKNRLEKLIHSTGFYKNKSKNLINCSKKIIKNFNGKVPKKMDQLLTLDGIGRKTANVILGEGYGQSIGVVVDTHVSRISGRLGFSGQKNPEKIEKDLMGIIPKSNWIIFTHLIIDHGRAICQARKPKCDQCQLAHLCPGKIETDKK